jgi:ABC-2 type transport system permease protein/oleandomycin transport system permease protein
MINQKAAVPAQSIMWNITDTLVIAWRNILRVIRLPQLLVFSTIQPVMLLLLFNYVFGGAIAAGGLKYIQFLLPGFLVQIVVFGSSQTSVGLAEDLSRGMIDRFRSLPMARLALLAGRTLADTLRYTFLVLLMIGVGYAMGFRFQNGIALAVAAAALAILFGFVFTWISAFIGMSVKDVETAQVAGFVWIFPIVFASSMFVPVETMPGWLQAFAKVNPVTSTTDTVRVLSLGGGILSPLWKSLAWIGGLLVVFLPLAVRQYRRLK